MIPTYKYLIEILELKYDRNVLLEIFNQSKEYARLKGLKWRETPKSLVEIEKATSVVIQYGDYMMLDSNKSNLSYNFLQHDYIKNLVNNLNFSHEITPGNIDIIWYRPGFEFEPHTDHYAASTMMWPIFPEDGGQPIDFYYKKDLEIKKGEAAEFKNKVSLEDIIYTHNYSTTYPTIFNSHWIHGIRKVANERAFLRLRINENFESIVEKYKNGKLIKNDKQ
jgi:hypothetical protein